MSVYGAFLLLFSTQATVQKARKQTKKVHRTNDLTLYSADILSECYKRDTLLSRGYIVEFLLGVSLFSQDSFLNRITHQSAYWKVQLY